MSRYRHALLAASLLAALPWALSHAQALQPLRVEQSEGEYRIPLGWLNNQRHAPIELRGAESRHTLKLPISPRLAIQEAKIEMMYTTSISLLPRSQLALTLDDRILAQLPIKADQPDNAVRIILPLSSLAPGYREIGFRAAQHYTNECEDPSAPELYTQIDSVQSLLRIKATRQAIKPSLARLSDIFDRRLWLDRYTLNIMLPPQALQQEALRQAAAQISQAIASVFDYLPVTIQLQEIKPASSIDQITRRFPGVNLGEDVLDAVLLGTRDQLLPFLSTEQAGRIKSGYLGIFRSDQDPTRHILVVSGTTPEEVRDAATLLNLPGLALPDREDVLLASLQLEQGYKRIQPQQIEKGWNSFSQLGFHTTSMKGMYPPPARLEFWTFREMLDPARPFIDLELNFAYGAGFDKKSALNVLLNGKFVQAIPMQDKHGDQVYRTKVKLPSIGFRPGINELSFEVSVIGDDVGGACEPIFTDNLRVSIFEDSRIELPPISDYMRLPDLGLFGKTALPYTRLSDGLGVGVLLSDLNPATLSSALTLVGKLRQVHKAPLTSLRLLAPDDDIQGLESLIVVGTMNNLPETIRAGMTAFLPRQQWQTLVVGSKSSADLVTGAKRWVDHPFTPLSQLSEVIKPALANIILSEGLGQSAALVQYVNDGLPVTVLTAADHTHLTAGATRLIEHNTWGALSGSAFLWSMDGEAIAKAEPIHHSFIGESPAVNPMTYLLSDRPWLASAVAIALVTLLALLTWWLLRQRARRLNMDT